MPYINNELDVDVDDFLDECDSYEIGEVIDWLKDEGHIDNDDEEDDDDFDEEPKSLLQQLFEEDLTKIKRVYLQISKEDFETINRIAKKY